MFKEVNHVSATSIALWNACQKKFFFRYILGEEIPVSGAMKLGTDTHSELEKYLKDGKLPDDAKDHGRIAKKGLSKLEQLGIKPGSVEVEVSLEKVPLLNKLPIPFKGYIDVLDRANRRILDHKTISNNKSALTPDDLKVNVQMIVYAKHLLDNLEDKTAPITITHLYFNTKNKKDAFESSVDLEPAYINEFFDKEIRSVVEQIKTFADQFKQMDFPTSEEDKVNLPIINANQSNCFKNWIKCPFADQCSNYKPYKPAKEEEDLTPFILELLKEHKTTKVIQSPLITKLDKPEGLKEEEMDLINKVANTTSRRSKYIVPGEYVLQVDNMLSGTTKAGRDFVAIEFMVLEYTGENDNEIKSGSMVTHLMLTDQGSTAKNIRDFLCKVLNVSDDKLTKQHVQDAFTVDQRGFSPLRGLKVRCLARDTTTKSGGTFTIINYKTE